MRSIPSGVTSSWSWVMPVDALAPRGAKLGREEQLVVVHLDHLLRDELRPLSAQEDAGGEYLLQGEPVHAVQVDEVDRAVESAEVMVFATSVVVGMRLERGGDLLLLPVGRQKTQLRRWQRGSCLRAGEPPRTAVSLRGRNTRGAGIGTLLFSL